LSDIFMSQKYEKISAFYTSLNKNRCSKKKRCSQNELKEKRNENNGMIKDRKSINDKRSFIFSIIIN
jgi:hypothetical protein